MKRIKTFAELLALEPGTKIHVFTAGKHRSLTILAKNPKFEHYPLLYAYSNSNVSKTDFFTERLFGYYGNKIQIYTGYETESAGLIMKSQLEEEIVSIEKVYINKNENQ